ncbi:MAG: HAMP domain-containing protein [Acidobacteriota bacterium]|nr:HAMP domain-containing protein [Acidobacteriota bacterium]
MKLRTRLILAFLAATLAPLLLTIWVALSSSTASRSTRELDEVSRDLERTGREFYRTMRENLARDVREGRAQPDRYNASGRSEWPASVEEFWSSGEPERFVLGGDRGDRLDYLVRGSNEVSVYSGALHGIQMQRISDEYARARAVLSRDLDRGFAGTLLLLSAAIWVISFAVLAWWAHRISRPVRQLTAGLSQVAAGKLETRVTSTRDDEIGAAIVAFNDMTAQLERSRERLVWVTRLESWQALARKMAHEVKNSLTPIRLTMEEISARHSGSGDEFLNQAAQIVVDEVIGLERRVRAFSEFASEPPVHPGPLDVNALLGERIALLRNAHPEVRYDTRLSASAPVAFADEDLVRGLLTNLLENAAQAAHSGGHVLGVTTARNGHVAIEVHDSGPGLSEQARASLFEPTISFKPGGMGLGLSIARRSAVLSGGDITLVASELGGAAFRVVLPVAERV